jgi:integrase
MSVKNLNARSFKTLLERADLPCSVRVHDLRYVLLKLGQHSKLVQELLGHATISQTMGTYSHVLPGMGERTPVAMGNALS